MLLLLGGATGAHAAACTSAATGNWSAAATWAAPCNVAGGPVAADTVTMASGHTVTVDVAAAASTVTFPTVAAATGITISGTNSLTVTGLVSMARPATGGASTIAVGAGTFTAGSLTMSATTGAARTNTLSISTGSATVSGAANTGGVASRVTFSGAGTLTFAGARAGAATLTTVAGSTVKYTAAAAQTVITGAYNGNLILAGSGAKTTATVTVNGTLSMEGAATASAAPTYGAAATLQYNTATARNAGVEWRTPFTATGGVIVANTGAITLNGAKVFNASVPLAINSGATLATGNFQVTLGGNFVNNGGTFTAGSSTIVIANTMAAQSIAGFTTTGAVSMTKTAGTATLTGNVNGGAFTLNGNGGALDLGAGLTHTFSGAWTRTNGALLGNSSTLNIGGTTTNTAGTFAAGTSTVNYTGAAQTIANVAYYNLGFSGSGAKTMGPTMIGNDFTMSGAATTAPTGALAVGGNFTIGANNTFTAGAFAHSVGGNWSNSGAFTAGASTVTFNGMAAQTIGGAATTSFNNLTIANTGAGSTTLGINTSVAGNLSVNTGTLDLAAFTLNRTAAGGALTVGNGATLKIGGTNSCPSNYTSHALGASSTIEYNGTNQTVCADSYGNLTIDGSGVKAAGGAITVTGALTLTAGTFAVGANTLTLNGPTIAGTPANLSTTAASSLSFGGAASGVNLPGSVLLLSNLTVNNGNGITLNSSPAVGGVLTLTSGAITTGANILSASANCPASVARTGGFVSGNLRLTFPTGETTCTYHVGSGGNYAPIVVAMTASAGGTLTGSTTGNEHPQIASSAIDPNKDVNRYWSLWMPGDTVVATSYDATFNFVAGDLDIAATATSFVVGKYVGGAWSLPVPVTAAATSTGVTGIAGPIAAVTDFAAGEAAFVCSVPAGSPVGTTCVCDNFNRATLNPSTIYGGNWNVSSSSGAFGLPRIVANKLRLTDNSIAVSTAATAPGTFPAAGNWIAVEFKHYAYSGTGADGMAFTLSDSTIQAAPGAFGGSLGYAQKCQNGVAGCVSDCDVAGGCPGFTGGWIGLGLDEYGNYSNGSEGRSGGPGLILDSVAVRGSGSGQAGYPYLAGSATLNPGIDNAASATPAYGHAYRLTVDARNYTWDGVAGAKTAMVSLERDTTGTGASYAPLVPPFDAYVANPLQANVPANWQISLTGSTGASMNIHEIADLKICAQTYVPPAGYRIQVDNLTPTTCPSNPQPTVTVSALKANNQVITTYAGAVNLSATLLGGGASSATWSPYPGNLGVWDGVNNRYTFAAGDNGVVKFYLSDLVQQNVYITVSEHLGTLSSTLGAPVQFSSGVASFAVSTPDALGSSVVAGRPHLMRITRNQVACGGGTDTTFAGAKQLDGWYDPAAGDHPAGALAPQVCAPVSGVCIPSYGSCQTLSIAPPVVDSNSNNLSLTFAAGVADFCLVTSDVGKYSVGLRDDSVATGTPAVTGASTILTARPFAVVVSDVRQGATDNPANGTSDGSVFAKAGTAFQATVAGYLWNGAGDTGSDGLPDAAADWSAITAAGIAPHYADTVTLAASAPFAPAAGVLSGGSVAVASGSTTSTTLSYSEVGSFTLAATPSASYLNTAGVGLGNRVAIFSNPASTARNGLVGRFIPDHFALSGMSITNRFLYGCAPASTFTYAGEGLRATFTLEAQNAANSPTVNYLTANGYAKLDGAVPTKFNFGAVDLADAVPPLTVTHSVGLTLGASSGAWAAGGQGTFDVDLAVNRAAAPDGPFESFNLGVDPVDTDGVRLAGYNLDVNNDATHDHGLVGTSKIRFGRLKLSNAHGSELLNLPVPMEVQFWNGGTFVTNGDDSCTQIGAANVGLANYTKNLAAGETLVSTGTAFNAGVGSLVLSKPGATNNGSVDLVINLGDTATETPCTTLSPDPVTGGANLGYLRGLWCGAVYDRDPTARATFGVFKGNNEFIYLRENY